MTDQAKQHQDWFQYLQADKQHQKLEAVCNSINEEIRAQDSQIHKADYTIMQLQYVYDVLQAKSWDLEALPKKHEKFAKKVLGKEWAVDGIFEMLGEYMQRLESQKRDAFLLAGEAVAKRKELEKRLEAARKDSHARWCQVHDEHKKLMEEAKAAEQSAETQQSAEAK